MTALTQHPRILFVLTVLTAALVMTTGLLSAMSIQAWPPDGPETNVGGEITSDTTWTLTGSPYVLTSNLTVAAGVTLTIEPGVVVVGGSGTGLFVAGHLEAIGTEITPITFTSIAEKGPGEWLGLRLSGSAHINRTIIRFADSDIGMTNPSGGPILIENSTLSHSANYPLLVDPDAMHRLQMDNVTFADNAVNRVFVDTVVNQGTLVENVTLTAQPGLEGYEINGAFPSFVVPPGITFTLGAGLSWFMPVDGLFTVWGHLKAVGTAVSPITFTSISDLAPGQWLGIRLPGSAHFDHTVVRNAGVNIGVMNAAGGQIFIENSTLSDSADYPLLVDPDAMHRLQMDNVSFVNNNKNRVLVDGVPFSSVVLTENVTLTGQPGLEGYEVVDFVIIVPAGITMTLQPGVTIMATDSGYCPISVAEQGHLEAVGTSEAPVTFTSTSDFGPGEWTSICVAGAAHFDHAEFRNGMFNLDIWGPTGGEVFVENSTIISSSYYGMWTYPDSLHRLRMDNVVFTDNEYDRVLIDLGHDVYELTENTTLSSQPGLEGYELNAPHQTSYQPILRIPAGVTLTMEAGTTLMAPVTEYAGGVIAVLDQGHLEAQGTADSPVTFTSATDSGPGEWTGLVIAGSAQLDHTIVRNGVLNVGLLENDSDEIRITNSVVSNSSEYPMIVWPEALHRLQMFNVAFTDNLRNRILIEPSEGNEALAGSVTLTAQPGLEGYVIKPWDDPTPQLAVRAGLTLTVAPSVTVMMAENTLINVAGHLAAEGTAVSPITFTSITDTLPGEWGGLIVSGTASFDHAIIRNGQRNLDVLAGASVVSLNNSEVGQASGDGLAVAGGEVTAVCTTFSHNNGDAIYVTGSPNVTVFSSSISGNGSGVNNVGGTAVDARQNWWGDASGPGGEGPGIGDAIWGNVLYDPWLNEPTCSLTPYQLFLPVIIGP
ncbi:MAG: hypothetical protein H6667_11335 [Ardenticatenaceae bacterium]|nr:hypothetical protein [Ardenticatenaceae bacterium]